jgi:hypothetical protein
MDVPEGHVGVDSFHVIWNFAHGSIILEGGVLSVGVREQSRGKQCSVEGSIPFGLELLVDGRHLEPIELLFPSSLGSLPDSCKVPLRNLIVEIHFCIFLTDVGDPDIDLKVGGVGLND